jgi:hypothetical protein
MKLRIVTSTFLVLISIGMQAQEYFQQEVNYALSVTLNDTEHSLTGFETIQYINNSPDQLNYLYFHLWPNAYKDNTTAFARQQIEDGKTEFYFASKDNRGYIDSLEFRVNSKVIVCLPDGYNIDICKLVLNEPLLQGDTIIITTPFYVKIPGSFSRLGHVGQSYQISQWYPKPAVYDRNGWNQMPYLDQGEFYSEFGSFDVSITLPANYVVGATGNLITREEIEWLDKKTADTAVVVNFPASVKESKTIRYTEKNIHDFAWFADKRYQVQKGEVILSNNRKVTTWAMFTKQQAVLWKNAIVYINDAIRYYSLWYGNYPYTNCSAIYASLQSGGAMEYPTITVVGDAGTPIMLENFIMHEVGHNWFYGTLGFNERRYPFLDEGVNSFSEFRYMRTKYPGLKLYKFLFDNESISRLLNLNDLPFSSYYEISYLLSARNNMDQPLNLPSETYTSMNYGMVVYHKASLSFTYLSQYLGEEKFNRIIRQFYQEWQFRHPDPKDLRHVFEENCTEDLSWFFDDLITTSKKIDYALRRIGPDKVLVRNTGKISSPVSLTSLKDNDIQQVKWYPGFKGKQWIDLSLQSADKVVLFDSVWLPEITRKNNMMRTHGPLKWVEPLNIRPIQIVEKPDRTQIGILPAIGWNYYNGTLLGLLLYSPAVPQQTFEYQLVPMVGLGNHDVAGLGKISLNLFPVSAIFQAVQLSLDARRFGYGFENGQSYDRVKGEMLITFKNTIARSPVQKTLKFGAIAASELGIISDKGPLKNYFLTMDAGYSNRNVLNPYGVSLNVELNNDYARSSLEVNYAHALNYAKNAIHLRLFAGGFIEKESDFNNFYALRLSGTSGIHDYKYENLFFGRFENITDADRQPFLSQQFVLNEGGFVSNNPFAFSNKWLVAVGLTIKIPRLPVWFFANAGTYSGAGETIWKVIDWNIAEEKTIVSDQIVYEVGGMINLGDFIKVYFPVFTSHEITAVNDALTDNYFQTIRYIIDFNAINPFKLKNRIFQ